MCIYTYSFDLLSLSLSLSPSIYIVHRPQQVFYIESCVCAELMWVSLC